MAKEYALKCAVCKADYIGRNTRSETCSIVCRNKNRYIKYPDNSRRVTARIYGLTVEQYQQMEDEQQGTCYICKNPEVVVNPHSGRTYSLCIDHCHNTGKVRKLLCKKCNLLVGHLENSLERVERCLSYITELKAQREV